MRASSVFAAATCCLLLSAVACGGNVVVDARTTGSQDGGATGGSSTTTGSSSGTTSSGTAPSDACGEAGPVNPKTCVTDGASCSAPSSQFCFETWTCMGGTWTIGMACSNGGGG